MHARGDVQILQHAQLFEDGCGLERPADAEAHDHVRLHREEVVAAEHRFTGAPRQAGQRIDERRLPRAVRSDQEVQSTLQEGEVDALHRLEAVEVDGQVADLQVVLTEERGGHVSAAGSA